MINDLYGAEFHKIYVTDIDKLCQYFSNTKKIANKINTERLSEEFSLGLMGCTSIALMAMSINASKNDNTIFPKDYLNDGESPDSNFIIECQLTQIANHCNAIIQLAQSGIDNPSRSLVRVLIELTQQTIVMLYDKRIMRAWATPKEDKESNRMWFKLFGRGKLNKAIEKIENEILYDPQAKQELIELRKFKNRFYSQTVHHSYIATMVGSQAHSFDDDNLSRCLLSCVNRSVKVPVTEMNYCIWYFLINYYTILDKVHDLRPNNVKGSVWLESFSLYLTLRELFVEYYKKS
jgi:hypothetical protein